MELQAYSNNSYFAWFSDLALKRQRYILLALVVGVIAMSDGGDDNNESGDDDIFAVFFTFVHWFEWFRSSCAKVLFVSSFGIVVDTAVLSLRLYMDFCNFVCCCSFMWYVQNLNAQNAMVVFYVAKCVMKMLFNYIVPRDNTKNMENNLINKCFWTSNVDRI